MDVNFCPSPASGQTSRDRDDRHKRRENRHRESDREKRPRHGHEGGREGRRAHTGGERKKAPPEKEDDNKVKYIVVVVVILLVIGGIGGLVYFVSSPADSGLACDREKTKDPVLGNECSEPACTFDVGQCPLPCPFGYTMKNSSVTCPINCNCAAQGQFQGDVQFGDEDVPDLLAMFDYVDREDEEFSLFSGSAYKLYSVGVWSVRRREDGTVPVAYTLTDKLLKDPWMMDAIDTAVKWLKESTCVRWERYDPKKHLKEHVVDIADRKSCSSVIGMRKGTVKQQMSLTVYCNWPSVVVHEMIHTLGFFHEHTRPDRD
uniref:Metalloendopeptidase n=1 Tax=Ciona savignyi TaxID=51511 RepID=H2ZLK2_CIOSA